MLSKQDSPFKTEMYSLRGNVKAVEGGQKAPDIIDSNSDAGVVRYRFYDDMGDKIHGLLGSKKTESLFAETISMAIGAALNRTEALGAVMETTTLTQNFPQQCALDGDQPNDVSRQLKQVAKLIKLRSTLTTERDMFFVEQGGFDTHFDMLGGIDKKYHDQNVALEKFQAEMRSQGIWDNVVLVTSSDFARTLTSNGRGTDHGWGGHYYMAGGKVKQQILGTYPDMREEAPLNLGRGRIIPQLPWEAIWNGVAAWFGVDSENMAEVLPNAANFQASSIFSESDLFNV